MLMYYRNYSYEKIMYDDLWFLFINSNYIVKKYDTPWK